MYRAPRTSRTPALLLVAALLIPTLSASACATAPEQSAQNEQRVNNPLQKRKRFYDPWGQPQEENTPGDTPPEVEYEESDEL